MRKVLPLLLVCISGTAAHAQLDSIYDQGKYRTFILHLPSGYSTSKTYPLMLDIHGLNSSAVSQQAYSDMGAIADTAGFIVVYPNAVSGSWNLTGNSDADFLRHLVDTIRKKYSVNDCLFSTGMSMGGFMTYKLVCVYPSDFTAIAVVSGNMTQALENSCSPPKGIPVMHFHGTEDKLVSYNGIGGLIPSVETTIGWWVNKNNCSSTPIVSNIADINTTDSSTVTHYYYQGGKDNSEVQFYKITNGGHTWPGAVPVHALGHTCQDIKASQLIWSFFKRYCANYSAVNTVGKEQVKLYPVPASERLYIQGLDNLTHDVSVVELLSLTGESVLKCNIRGSGAVDISVLAAGTYLARVTHEGRTVCSSIVVKE